MATLNVHIEDPYRIEVARVHCQVLTKNDELIDDLLRSIAATCQSHLQLERYSNSSLTFEI